MLCFPDERLKQTINTMCHELIASITVYCMHVVNEWVIIYL